MRVGQVFVQHLRDGRFDVPEEDRETCHRLVELAQRELRREHMCFPMDLRADLHEAPELRRLVGEEPSVGVDVLLDPEWRVERLSRERSGVEGADRQEGAAVAHAQVAQQAVEESFVPDPVDRRIEGVGAAPEGVRVAAKPRLALHDQDALPRFRQQRRRRQTADPAADDDDIVGIAPGFARYRHSLPLGPGSIASGQADEVGW